MIYIYTTYLYFNILLFGVVVANLQLKGIGHSKSKFHPITTHLDISEGSGNVLQST